MASKKRYRDEDFIAQLAAYSAEQRELIEAECTGFRTDAAERQVRRERARTDFGFFAKTYFPHFIRGDASEFHKWFHDKVPRLILKKEGQLINVSAPRGEAKSTLGTQLLAIWCIVFDLKHFMPIVMDSFDQAATMLEAIKTELTDNPRLAMDFPDHVGAGRVWNAGTIITRTNVKMQAFGSGKRMRGVRHGPHRPDLVFLDDIENDEQVRSKEQRDKTEKWVNKVVLNLGPPDGSMDVLYLNTILHYDSVANRTHKRPRWVRAKFKSIIQWPHRMDLWQKWEEVFLNDDGEAFDEDGNLVEETAAVRFYREHQAEMDAGAVVSWPSMRPLLRLMMIRADDHHAFDCEQQNDPSNDEHALFKAVHYWVLPSRDWVYYGANDPSLGKHNKGRDPCAILVGGYDRKKGVLDVVEARIARMVPDRQIATIIELQREYKCLVWGVEAVQFQEFFRTELVKRSAAAKCPVPAVPVTPHTDKGLRIESLSPHVANALIRFRSTQTVLLEQLRHYPEADHDDGPDALEILWKLALAGAGGIPKVRMGAARIKPIQGRLQ